MSLRDYFAGQESLHDWDDSGAVMSVQIAEVLAGCSHPGKSWAEDPIGNFTFEAKWRAALRYIRADAMIAARHH